MRKALNLMSFVMGMVRGSNGKKRNLPPIAALEPLECRRLMSASAAPVVTGLTLDERKNVIFTADLGNFVYPAPGTGLEATISWGDGKSSIGVIKSDGTTGIDDENNFEVDGTHTYTKTGRFHISVAVLDAAAAPTPGLTLVTTFLDTAIVTRLKTMLD